MARKNCVFGFRIDECDILESNGSAVGGAASIATQTVNYNLCINRVVGACVLLAVNSDLKVCNFRNGYSFAADVIKQGDCLSAT